MTIPTLLLSLALAADPAPPATPLPTSSIMVPEGATPNEIVALASQVVPAPRQLAWQARGFTAFVHFGMNTFTDREWGEGDEDPDLFAPEDLDADQWVRAFASAGMTGVVLTCKHHDGFCLWPTETTAHSVRSSAWRDGGGDVVREVADACRRAGLAFGIYLSPWDRNHPDYGTPAYDLAFRAQLRELLTGYGTIAEVWLDGANAPGDDPARFDWSAHFALVRELQPEACIAITGPDVRWCGNEAGRTRAAEWSVIPLETTDPRSAAESFDVFRAYRGVSVAAPDLGSRAQLASARRLVWWPAVVNTSIRPGWFHHAAEDDRLRSLGELLAIRVAAEGGNAHLLLNVPPDARGLIPEGDVRRLAALGEAWERTFACDLAEEATAAPRFRMAGELHFASDVAANLVVLEEEIATQGQRVERFRIEAWLAGGWREVARGTTIGARRILAIPETTSSRFRYWIDASRGRPGIARFALHRAPRLAPAPTIERDGEGRIVLAAPEGLEIRFTTGGGVPDARSPRYRGPISLLQPAATIRAASFVLDDATWMAPGGPAIAERSFGPPKTGWRIAACDSEQAPGEAAAHAIDENPDTIWHSRWSPDAPAHPHFLAIDLGAPTAIRAATYLPRRDGTNGRVTRCTVAVSDDGVAWRQVAEATFADAASSAEERTIPFGEVVVARYLKFTALAAVDGRPWASAAEVGILTP